jgi:hypothetical protein
MSKSCYLAVYDQTRKVRMWARKLKTTPFKLYTYLKHIIVKKKR